MDNKIITRPEYGNKMTFYAWTKKELLMDILEGTGYDTPEIINEYMKKSRDDILSIYKIYNGYKKEYSEKNGFSPDCAKNEIINDMFFTQYHD